MDNQGLPMSIALIISAVIFGVLIVIATIIYSVLNVG